MQGGYIDLIIYVKPRSRETKLVVEGGELVFYTTEPPVGGRANASLVKYLSRRLGVPKSSVEIARGVKGRVKVVRIHGVSRDDVLTKLAMS